MLRYKINILENRGFQLSLTEGKNIAGNGASKNEKRKYFCQPAGFGT